MNKFRLRRIIQIVTFSIGVLIFVLLATGVIASVAHQRCPYSVVCFGLFGLNPTVEGGFLPVGTLAGVLVTVPLLMLVFTVATLFIGRLFCGYVCPLGTLQEWLYAAVNRGKCRFRQRVPYGVHRWLKWLKYLVLLATAALAFFGAQWVYMRFCPVITLAHPSTATWVGFGMLAVIVGGGMLVERFWCRYLCPYAALMNLFMHLGNWARVPRLHITRNIKTSLECFNCLNYCPMYIDIGYNEAITNAECIQCRRCVRSCTKSKDGKKKCLYAD